MHRSAESAALRKYFTVHNHDGSEQHAYDRQGKRARNEQINNYSLREAIAEAGLDYTPRIRRCNGKAS